MNPKNVPINSSMERTTGRIVFTGSVSGKWDFLILLRLIMEVISHRFDNCTLYVECEENQKTNYDK